MEYTLYQSSKRKSIGVQVHLEKGLIVRAPKMVSLKRIEVFLIEKSQWILKKMEYRDTVNSRLKNRNFLHDDAIEILGKSVIIKHHFNNHKRLHTRLESDIFNIYLPHGYDVALNREKLKRKIIGWYKVFAMNTIKDRLSQFSSQFNLHPSDVKVRSYKSRWGACRQDGKILFNWRIVQAPLRIVDYVIIHELCHLKFMNHSKGYWNLVASACPNYKEIRKWLKENVLQLKFE